jgi:hypothetical protein
LDGKASRASSLKCTTWFMKWNEWMT